MYPDGIVIYTKDPGQTHVEVVRRILDQLRKHGLFTNMKKCWFHQDEVQFLGLVVSVQRIRIEEKKIEAVKTWPEPQSIRNIQIFISFVNFYYHFIKSFRKIAASLTSMLKTITPATSKTHRIDNKDDDDEQSDGGVDRADGVGVSGNIKNLSKTKII